MHTYTVPVPTAMWEGRSALDAIGPAILQTLRSWVDAGRPQPSSRYEGPSKVAVVGIDGRLNAFLKKASSAAGASIPDFIRDILAHKAATADADIDSFGTVLARMGLKPHKEQLATLAAFRTISNQERVGLVESPTGSGKTFAIAYQALHNSLTLPGRTLIAVPTINLAHQTCHAIERMRSHWPAASTIPVHVILGRQEFVNIDQLLSLASVCESQTREAIYAWVETGGRGATSAYPAWTMAGILHWLDAHGISDLDLNIGIDLASNPDCERASASHKEQFEVEGEILIVSHAMLARDLMTCFVAATRRIRENGGFDYTNPGNTHQGPTSRARAWYEQTNHGNHQRVEALVEGDGRLPDWHHLIIDEGHLLRENFDLALTTGISVSTLISDLRKLAKAKGSGVTYANVNATKSVFDALMKHGYMSLTPNIQIDWSAALGLDKLLVSLAEAVPFPKTSAVGPNLENAAWNVYRAKRALESSIKHRLSTTTQISWSPSKQWPTIKVGAGQSNLTAKMNMLWHKARSSIVLSATLATPGVHGDDFTYMQRMLGIPDKKFLQVPAIRGKWLTKPVILHLPSPESAKALTPPKEPTNPDWVREIGFHIAGAAESSQKGILVLNMSRDATKAICEYLEAQGLSRRLINGSQFTTNQGAAGFVRMASEGKRPIWISHGPAWTGVDLPTDALEHVIIPRLPYRPPVSTTAEQQSGNQFVVMRYEMLIRLRQGIGRLIRQIDVKDDKHLWILDGRVHSKKHAHAMAALAQYGRREPV